MSPPPASETASEPSVKSHLGLWDAVSIIVGIVIGAGIYETAPAIFGLAGSPGKAMLAWVAGGVLSVVGALCYAELATTYPRQGGDYFFLRRAFGPWAGFLFGWSQLTVIMSGSLGLMAFIFADYAVRLFGATPAAAPGFAVASIVVISAMNILGLRTGQRTQNVLTSAKVLGLGAIIVAGLCWPQGGSTAPAEASGGGGGGGIFAIAMILVLYTYGGWNDAAFVVAEMRDKNRNIPRALLLGTGGVALVYVLINLAYLNALGFDGAKNSKAIAADVLAGPFGENGARLMSLLVMISALGALNGMTLTGARIYAAAGVDFPVFAWLARWHPRLGTPVAAVTLQAAFTIVMVLMVGTAAGRAVLDRAVQLVGFEPFAWEGHGGFDSLLKCTAPVFWLFFLAAGVSLFVLRSKDRGIERPFRVPAYPVVPLVFCATCGWMLYRATTYAGKLAWLGVLPVVLGIAAYLISTRGMVKERPEIRSDDSNER
jgi:basic amino acid/polyamine antiporter, APA family